MISEDGVMGICSFSETLVVTHVTIFIAVYTLLIGVCVFCASILIKSLNVSHSLSNSVLTDDCCTMRGGIFNCGEVEICCCESSLDWAVSFTDPSLLECSEVSLPDFYLDLFVAELLRRLTLGVGSLMGSKRNLSRGIVVNLLSLYILNS